LRAVFGISRNFLEFQVLRLFIFETSPGRNGLARDVEGFGGGQGCPRSDRGGRRLRFHGAKLFLVSVQAIEKGDGHTTGVLVFVGDEWKTVWRVSIQPRGLLEDEVSKAGWLIVRNLIRW
jgi:hypothetical protein